LCSIYVYLIFILYFKSNKYEPKGLDLGQYLLHQSSK